MWSRTMSIFCLCFLVTSLWIWAAEDDWLKPVKDSPLQTDIQKNKLSIPKFSQEWMDLAKKDEADWRVAKTKITAQWLKMLAGLNTTSEQNAFIKQEEIQVAFVQDLPGKVGTYSREKHRLELAERMFKSAYRDYRHYLKMPGREATQTLSVISLPVFAHLIRDQMMDKELREAGFMYTGGWLEDEVIHHKEMAGVIRELMQKSPEAFEKLKALRPLDEFSDLYRDILKTESKGDTALALYVESRYPGIASVITRNDVVGVLDEWIRRNEGERKGVEGKINECRNKGTYTTTTYFNRATPGGQLIPGYENKSHRCERDWQTELPKTLDEMDKQIKFLKDANQLAPLELWYRQQLARWKINPASLSWKARYNSQ